MDGGARAERHGAEGLVVLSCYQSWDRGSEGGEEADEGSGGIHFDCCWGRSTKMRIVCREIEGCVKSEACIGMRCCCC